MRLLNFGLYSFFCLLSLHVKAQHPGCVTGYQARDQDEEARHQQFLDQIKAVEGKHILQSRDVKHFEVVIHVVSTDDKLNVSQAQVLQQLDVLNADFAGMGDNIGKLPVEFKSLVADAGLQFCLASLDPDGQPTTGITFTHTDLQHVGTQYGEGGRRVIQYDELGGKTGWDPKRYINIWIGDCENILGSSSMPDDLFPMEEIGLVIDDQHFGAFGPSGSYGEFGRGHTLTHEMGHFFGLQHIWGHGLNEDCSDSDDIDDTPNAAGPHYGCPTGEVLSCGDQNMYQNFMDLTDDRCLAAFTHGQVA
ncbi:MAG TPA: M43 family zinc metalloprotease, partial [Saprospiraceae bacterium]|nr:M43 family zinc metalloprotease [Saprospiraceae bacterium]